MNLTTFIANLSSSSSSGGSSPVSVIISLILTIAIIAGEWAMFTKAGKPGWAAIIPIYNAWVLFEIICGRGTAFLRLFIPIYNIYWWFKSHIALAHSFGKGSGFGIVMAFFYPICYAILGFGSAEYEGPQDI